MTKKEVSIDLSDVKTNDEFHTKLKTSLGFPSWYGMNWHAFWDAITGLVELPRTLIFIGWNNIEEILPEDAKYCKYYLQKRNDDIPERKCTIIYK